ncbi:hypothetical protein EC890511_3703, partial [Escherichia coli 89.0511]
KSNEVSILYS